MPTQAHCRTVLPRGDSQCVSFRRSTPPTALRQANGEQAHTACVGFGLERITLALLSRHGLDVDTWPGDVTKELWPG